MMIDDECHQWAINHDAGAGDARTAPVILSLMLTGSPIFKKNNQAAFVYVVYCVI